MELLERLRRVATSPITEAYSWLGGRQGGADLIDVSQAVPGYPPPLELREHLARLVLEPGVSRYTDQLGIAELRAELAAATSRLYGGAVAAAEVGITAGCNQAFCLAAGALAREGDEVLLPLPVYFNHDMWLRALGVEPRYLPSGADMLPDPERARALLGPRTRAIVLISPNNPTGAVYPRALIGAFFELCRERGLALLLDETYRDFCADPGPPHDLFTRAGWQQTLIQLFSFSKVYCLAGYRTGALVAGAALLEEVAKLMDCVAICPPRLGQEGALYGLRHLDAWRERNRRAMAERVEVFRSLLEQNETRCRVVSAGAYFAYVDHGERETSREVARRWVEERSVLCLAGEMFGPGQERYLRLAFANLEPARMVELVERLPRRVAAR